MRKVIFILAGFLPALLFAQPCTTGNGAGCVCLDGTDTCVLLPDITISWFALQSYLGGPTEYSQTANGVNNGRLKITGSTPNIGRGPFTVRGVDRNGDRWFLCGADTFSIHDPNSNTQFSCPNGETPQQIIFQRIYEKTQSVISYTERMGGTMTYHASHGHNHVDDWVTFTLRIEDPDEPDTLKWQIVGSGAKLGFCLEDYGSCNTYNGHCRDNQTYGSGTILTNANIPNYGMGGGNYNCSPIEQGISVGYTDIYDENLDGMWINIPPNTCNGNYWIVAQADPKNYFIESNENNNWTAIPFTLTKQLPAGSAAAEIDVNGAPYLCNSTPVVLETNTAISYLWSTGDSTKSISVAAPGDYYVSITSLCGSAVSDTISITSLPAAITNTGQDSTCMGGAVELTAQGPGVVNWYDAPVGGNLLDTGTSFITPLLQNTTVYYAENVSSLSGAATFSDPHYHTGTSFYSSTIYNGSVIFDCYSDFVLQSVKVYTEYPGNRTIELRNSTNVVLQSLTVYVSQDTQRIILNFPVSPGTNYELGTNDNDNANTFGVISPKLKRTSNGLNYPYVINGVLSLNDSPNGQGFYYYFYDWKIQTGAFSCTGPREPVTAVVLPSTVLSISGLDPIYQITDAAATLNGNPAGGVFSGDGVTGNVFDPAVAGLGNHSISYSYTDENGCYNIQTVDVSVVLDSLSVGIVKNISANGMKIFPNPTNGVVNIELNFFGQNNAELRIHNSIGKLVFSEMLAEKTNRVLSFDLSGYAAGIYFVEIIEPNEVVIAKFVKQ